MYDQCYYYTLNKTIPMTKIIQMNTSNVKTFSLCKRLSICIIDDNPIVLTNHTEIIRNMGCERYRYFRNIYDAMAFYNGFHETSYPDLIISEWYRDFIESCFCEGNFKSIPIAIVTPPERSKDRDKIMDKHTNIKAFLDKPLDPFVLKALIKKVFRTKKVFN